MFRDAKRGDRIWLSWKGWEVVVDVNHSTSYPIIFSDLQDSITFDGKRHANDKFPSAFWGEVKIVPPPKPKKKVMKYPVAWRDVSGNE